MWLLTWCLRSWLCLMFSHIDDTHKVSSPVWMSPRLWSNKFSTESSSIVMPHIGLLCYLSSYMWMKVGLWWRVSHIHYIFTFLSSVIFHVYKGKAPAELFPTFITFVGVPPGWVLSCHLSLEHWLKLSHIGGISMVSLQYSSPSVIDT